jgi:phosphopantetheinyl transferase (holo-ACP synthase)
VKSFVGNDLIDFVAPHNCGRAQRSRLAERVLTLAERDRLKLDGDGDRGFARLWSAKEAAYKAARKRDPALVFAPRRWQVDVGARASSCGHLEGSVAIAADTRVLVRWEQADDWLHCVALLGEPPDLLDQAVAPSVELDAGGDFSEHERQGFTCRESAAVRNLAKRLLLHHGVGGIEIRRGASARVRLPPRAYSGERPLCGIDLSLSHDGRFVGAVIAMDSRIHG